MSPGVIGTGAMGASIAANLIDRGMRVHIRDLDPARESPLAEAGAIVHSSPADMVAAVDVVFIVVETARQIDDVLAGTSGLLAGLLESPYPIPPNPSRSEQGMHALDGHGSLLGTEGSNGPRRAVFLCSTIAPADTERIALAIQEAGADAIDAPISGGPARARDGTMSMMLAAPDAVLDRHAAIIASVARRTFRISPRQGDGARAKLANNLAAGAYLAAASEALALAVRMGLDPDQMQRLMAASSGQSWIADDRLPRALAGLCAPVGAATRVLCKDLTLATAAARDAGADVPMGDAALARFQAALAADLGDFDDSALYRVYWRE